MPPSTKICPSPYWVTWVGRGLLQNNTKGHMEKKTKICPKFLQVPRLLRKCLISSIAYDICVANRKFTI